MRGFTQYDNLDEVFNYLFEVLPEPGADRIASVSKYAMVSNQRIEIKAIKSKLNTGFSWNLEVTIDQKA
ncbi:MAG TPA: hypothetical protein VF602_04120 [Pedobacter sp.]|jgi:hypothetical protein